MNAYKVPSSSSSSMLQKYDRRMKYSVKVKEKVHHRLFDCLLEYITDKVSNTYEDWYIIIYHRQPGDDF